MGFSMFDAALSIESVRSHLRDMLEELADLAENKDDDLLSELGLRLRLMSGEPALRTVEVDVEETFLHDERTGLKLIKRPRRFGSMAVMPGFRIDCTHELPEELCGAEYVTARDAVEAFLRAKKWRQSQQLSAKGRDADLILPGVETITVRPLEAEGWMVEYSGADNAQMFISGSKAESSARDLAKRLADAGRPSQTVVYARNGKIAGQYSPAL